jgi:hypothetical protein
MKGGRLNRVPELLGTFKPIHSMKSLIFLLLFLTSIGCAPSTVYICDSPNSIRYHLDKNCRGLKNCSHRIISVSLEKAKALHLTLCKWER